MTASHEAKTPEELAEQWEAEKPPAAGPLSTAAAAVVVLLLGIAVVLASLGLGVGSIQQPGAGLWPLMIGTFLIVSASVLAVTARRFDDAERFVSSSWLVLAGLGTMVLFALAVGTIGFEIPGAVLAFVWLRFLGRESWRLSAIGAVAMIVAFYLIFVLALQTPIPHLF
ncbi:tripartite tricarboxylate transporter TctB family protein [uncultured Aeromicrobium sp.]|uniref:tripartite tricarboxylate transporter TctB family protein n=1 Tax=uncultured Aeromicrobium sp. TaxID=337820 RepID=UPI002600BD87|nr:tripartite tricarboxylate transporter TctB family protein [uncultured Aeromicrobium sp.]